MKDNKGPIFHNKIWILLTALEHVIEQISKDVADFSNELEAQRTTNKLN